MLLVETAVAAAAVMVAEAVAAVTALTAAVAAALAVARALTERLAADRHILLAGGTEQTGGAWESHGMDTRTTVLRTRKSPRTESYVRHAVLKHAPLTLAQRAGHHSPRVEAAGNAGSRRHPEF